MQIRLRCGRWSRNLPKTKWRTLGGLGLPKWCQQDDDLFNFPKHFSLVDVQLLLSALEAQMPGPWVFPPLPDMFDAYSAIKCWGLLNRFEVMPP